MSASSPDRFELERFVVAQDAGGTYRQALSELHAGRKLSHWMWFMFPQLAGLGQSAMSRRYAISSIEEARAYLSHPVLGPRLLEATDAVANAGQPSAVSIFGHVDAMKLRSSMTLFAASDSTKGVFALILDRFFDGERDPATEHLLEQSGQEQRPEQRGD